MALGRYRNPPELKDEDKFGPFTKPQLLWVIVGAILGFSAYSTIKAAGASVLAVIVGLLILGIFIAYGCVTIPASQYLSGGGYPIRVLVPRLIAMRFKRRLYSKSFRGEKK